MNLLSLKCPECGARLEIEDGINTFYCKYCGAKIAIDETDPEIIKAKLHLKEMEHEEKMLQMKLEARDKFWYPNKYKTKEQLKHERTIIIASFIVCAIILVGCFMLVFFN